MSIQRIILLLFAVVGWGGNISSNAYYYDELGYPRMIQHPVIRGSITYMYSARGEKLQVNYSWQPNLGLNPIENVGKPSVPYARLTRDYVGNKVYEDKVLKKILLPNGYIENNIYYFYLRDHLGSTAVTAKSDGTSMQQLRYCKVIILST